MFKDKVVFITGSTRGIGLAIGKRLAQDGAHIIITGKTTEPQAKLEGTIHTAVKEIEASGGRAIGVQMDIRYEDQVQAAIDRAVEEFGGIDILINNASAIQLSDTPNTDMKRFDLMHSINTRGTFMASKLCIPYLKKSSNPHILALAPPIQMDPEWFGRHLAYTMSKYGMSLVIQGLSIELKDANIAVNALWPKTTIATAAVNNLLGGLELMKMSRKPEIVADAAYFILSKKSSEFTGQFVMDEEILRQEGVHDFTSYAVDPSSPLMPDIFL